MTFYDDQELRVLSAIAADQDRVRRSRDHYHNFARLYLASETATVQVRKGQR